MTKQSSEMVIPESFHRVKRTLVVLASASIVLELAAPSTAQTISLIATDLEIPTDAARLLIWTAGLYYMIGLFLEAASAVRVNNHLFGDATEPGRVDQAIEALVQQLQIRPVDPHINSGFVHALEMLKANPPTNDDYDQMQVDMFRELGIPIEMPDETAGRYMMLKGVWTARTAKVYEAALAKAAELEAAMNRHTDEVERVAKALPQTKDRLLRLSSSITRARKASFLWWEVRAPAALFIFATGAAGWGLFGR